MYQYAPKNYKTPQKNSNTIQRKYPFLKDETLPPGQILYHGTTESSAFSIQSGINFQLSPSQLGRGFYTSMDSETAKASIRSHDSHALVSITTSDELEGQCADTLQDGTFISPEVLRILMEAPNAASLSANAAKEIVDSSTAENKSSIWHSISNDDQLNEGNDFIKTSFAEAYDETIQRNVPTWLDQYKFTQNAASKIHVLNIELLDTEDHASKAPSATAGASYEDSCCLIC